jgi:uncharacterized membrane protein YqgA involved in biofilm formation
MRRYLLLIFLSLTSIVASAQDAEMADGMRAEGKIYVVVAILSLILIGLIGYLILLDRKVTRLENKISERK